MAFIERSHARTVVFGEDHVAALVRHGGEGRAFVVTTPGQRAAGERIVEALGDATLCAMARMHAPVAVTEAALALLQASGARRLVAIGGGSAIGLSKALALRTGLQQAVIPTTYAGSEMTPVLGETENGVKQTRRDEKLRPGLVIYDVALTLSLPPDVSAASGMNGLAHAVEALYAPDRTPLARLAAERAIALFRASLPAIVADPSDVTARMQALEAAYLAGYALGETSMGLHHKLAHALGGALDLPHAQTHAVLLPHVAAFNAAALRDALGPDPGGVLGDLARAIGTPPSLAALGMREADIEPVLAQVLAALPANPRPVGEAELRALLRAAWSGVPATQ